jgi:drug/metabolite transporter (DMT)-like permease
MQSSHLFGSSLALLSSLIFGAADFSGGVATRRHSPYQVLVLVGLFGIGITAVLGIAWGNQLPSWSGVLWGVLSGVVGFTGLVLLYRGLASGNSAIVSPTAGVVGASLPAIFASTIHGLLPAAQMSGLILAIPGILLVSMTSTGGTEKSKRGFIFGILAGLNFGLFFIFLSKFESHSFFFTTCLSRSIFSLLGYIFLRLSHLKLPRLRESPLSIVTGVIDPLGNVLFMAASQYTRMDIAAMLSSLYPVVTVFLSRIFLKESISRLQWAGIGLCLVAIVLISQ